MLRLHRNVYLTLRHDLLAFRVDAGTTVRWRFGLRTVSYTYFGTFQHDADYRFCETSMEMVGSISVSASVIKSVALGIQTTMAYIKPLDNLACNLKSTTFALENAKLVATGSLSLLIVLLEPCNSADHVSFEMMMYGDDEGFNNGCDTLCEVEHLVELASAEKYTLNHCHIFDIHTLLSIEMREELEDPEPSLIMANDTFQTMVEKLQPDVILSLQCSGRRSSNKFVQALSSSMSRAGTVDIFNVRGKDAILIRGFHPSVYLRDDYTEDMAKEDIELYQKMLRYCFEIAFQALRGRLHVDPDIENRWASLYPTRHATTKEKALRIVKKLGSLRDLDELDELDGGFAGLTVHD